MSIATTIGLNEPQTLIAMMASVTPPSTFLFDRYAPTNPDKGYFPTETVLVDYMDAQQRRLAPFRYKGHGTNGRRGFAAELLKPARIACRRDLSIADASFRQFGEAVFNGLTPAQRAFNVTMQDMTDLVDDTKRRLNAMTGNLLMANGYTMTYDDGKTEDDTKTVDVKFYNADEESDPSLYTPNAMWSDDSAHVLEDIKAMMRQTELNGGKAVDIIMGSAAYDMFLRHPEVKERFNIRNYEFGKIRETIMAQGANAVTSIEIGGKVMNIIEYYDSYTDENKQQKPYINTNAVIVCAPGCAKSLFAGVTQMEQDDKWYHTYLQAMTPKYVGKVEDDESYLLMTCRPVLAPVVKGGWTHALVGSEG